MPRAIVLSALLTATEPAGARGPRDPPTRRRPGRLRRPRSRRPRRRPTATPADDPDDETTVAPKTPATERRRAVETILGLWADVARDLVLVETGGLAFRPRHGHARGADRDLAGRSRPGAAVTFLERAARSAELLASNVSPELILDSLVLAWPAGRAAA